ncbi:MAG: hypothetical protein JRI93_06510 [Deltaproteobacteria bacterium]|nr:hypothetical protein [Deltaproteobacteria bacterium]MBW2612770.1 hypothetical protein [Deltaproteobacteria bacterium]MBW2632894.1 hypothetical protein [Deltaproteobacteria bacterium]MBW2677913.1 hypothetical protein [Deltaproteobacteria bacterium]
MITNKSRNFLTMKKKIVVMIAAAIFVLGCFAGVGFSVFSSNSNSDDASNSDTIIDYIDKAKALDAEVLNNPENTETWI